MKFFYKENSILNQAVVNFFEELNRLNKSEYNNTISIILLGSLSRGEGSWRQDANGNITLLSDLEFFTVYKPSFSAFDQFSREIERVKDIFFSAYSSPLFHVDNTYISINELSRLERKLLTYDATQTGINVVGDDVIHLLPVITIENINYEDIRDILAHRLFYVLYYGDKLKEENDLSGYRYLLAKNTLDFMIVYLVENHKLASGFVNRLEVLKSCGLEREKLDYFSKCLKIKLSLSDAPEIDPAQMEMMFRTMVEELFSDFNIPVRNYFINCKSIIRRKMGILKRSIEKKQFYFSENSFIKYLDFCLVNGSVLTKQDEIRSYILNGYPRVE